MRGRRLVSIPCGRGVAAVVRDGNGVSLVDDSGGGSGVTGHRPAALGPEAGGTLAGGLLPAGAVRAVVRDRAGREREATCGTEAWIALLPQPMQGDSPVVRFHDAAGELVAAPLPAGVELAPVEDAREQCPACGAADWGRVVAAPPWRYGHDGAGRPTAAVCRACGHEESVWAFYGPGAGGEVTDPDLIAELDARHARDATALARSSPFPPFGLVGQRPTLAGHGESNGRVDSITLAFETEAGSVTVETTDEEPYLPAEWAARQALERIFGDDVPAWPDGSETAVGLFLNARSRAHAAIAAATPVDELTLSVDGTPTRFAAVIHDDRFAAVAQRLPGGLTITIGGRGSRTGLALEPARL
jgi:hypothetical protein